MFITIFLSFLLASVSGKKTPMPTTTISQPKAFKYSTRSSTSTAINKTLSVQHQSQNSLPASISGKRASTTTFGQPVSSTPVSSFNNDVNTTATNVGANINSK